MKFTRNYLMKNIEEFLSDLNDKQKEAVLYFDSPLLILAGAGSGKTRVLTYKIAYIIQFLNQNPYNIFAVTFTNKAAEEMKNRIEGLLSFSIKNMWAGTFHSMCVRIIKMYRREKSLDYNFTIYDTSDSKQLVKKLIKEKDYTNILDYKTTLRTISNLKNKMISPEEYEDLIESDTQRYVKDVYYEYENFLRNNNALDFDSILLETVNILKEDADFKKRLQNLFKYILVDEYQDTNFVQYVLLKELFNGTNHISVVGDDDQSIYGFRGAEIRNILDFENDFPNTKIIKLEQNYRSTKNILNVSSTLIANNTQRKEKKLWSDFEEGEKVFIIQTENENQEAFFIAKQIKRMKNMGYKYNDFAVLYRTNAQSRPFEEMFRKFMIPYSVIGGIKFFERKEVKDILAYLNVLVNNKDNISLIRIINTPRRGIGKKAIENLERIAKKEKPLFEIIMNIDKYKENFTKQAYNGFNNFKRIFEQIEEYKDNAGIAVEKIIEISGYNDYLSLSPEIESLSRKENLQELINSATEFSLNSENNTIEDYLDMISLYTDIDNYEKNDDNVTIMTVHNAKGLEFKSVFISGMEEGLFPHSNSFEQENGVEEERRLFYVAMTRAKKHLYISYSLNRQWFGNNMINGASSFIKELPDEYIEKYFANNGLLLKKQSNKIKIQKSFTKSQNSFKINDRIIHPYWGEGIIKNIKGKGDNEIATIKFMNGDIKKIYIKYANLERKV